MRGDGAAGPGTSWAPANRGSLYSAEHVAELAGVMLELRRELGPRATWLAGLDPRGFPPRWLRSVLPALVESAPGPWWIGADLLHRLPSESIGEALTFRPPGPYRITVDCTGGREAHKPLHLGTAVRDADGGTSYEGRGVAGPDRDARPRSGQSRTATRVRCRTCGRDERRRDWWAGCDWLASLGVVSVDLSALGS